MYLKYFIEYIDNFITDQEISLIKDHISCIHFVPKPTFGRGQVGPH